MTFGEKLLNLRKSRNLSQEQLAEKLCVTRQAVSKWELNETLPDSENVIKLADMFYVSTEYLLNDDMDIDNTKKYIPVYADKYDTANLFGALASLLAAIIAVFRYTMRFISEYIHWYSLPQRDDHICVYGKRIYYETLDETVILIFLAVVIIVSLILAVRFYKKCNFQNKSNKNSK